jgi:uridine kinase
MQKLVPVTVLNTGKKIKVEPGTSLENIAKKVKGKHLHLGAIVNNRVKDLSYEVFKPKIVRFIDYSQAEGQRMYMRSLVFILSSAVNKVLSGTQVRVEFSVSKGYYCEVEHLDRELTIDDVFAIGDVMREIVKKDIPFVREDISTDDAIKHFTKERLDEKVKVFKTAGSLFTPIYCMDDAVDFFYGELVPSTGFVKIFDLVKYYDGMLLRVPSPENSEEMTGIILQDKMHDVFLENKEWLKILDIPGIGSLNEVVDDGSIVELIKIAEAMHEKKVAQLADKISTDKNISLVLISGPSSSGKTTFAKRLAIQLKVLGMKPVNISLDNYFVNREDTPLDDNGEYDFETIDALDIETFNDNLIKLMKGKEVPLPKFSFEKGERYYDGERLKIDDNCVILVEGIHALNPKLTHQLDQDKLFKIYVSALTSLSMDGHNRISTTDNRLIRRIVRDAKYRAYSALDTIKRWPSVRRGEEKYIFPYQEEADVMFNSSLFYEIGVLRSFVEPLLRRVPENVPEYAEAYRLLQFLSYIREIDTDNIPSTSILREFLGGSNFVYD